MSESAKSKANTSILFGVVAAVLGAYSVWELLKEIDSFFLMRSTVIIGIVAGSGMYLAIQDLRELHTERATIALFINAVVLMLLGFAVVLWYASVDDPFKDTVVHVAISALVG